LRRRDKAEDARKKPTANLSSDFMSDLSYWVKTDRKVALRLLKMMDDVLLVPFSGPGKPEPLQYRLAGCWSRRLTDQDRLVYVVSRDRIDFLQARYHY